MCGEGPELEVYFASDAVANEKCRMMNAERTNRPAFSDRG